MMNNDGARILNNTFRDGEFQKIYEESCKVNRVGWTLNMDDFAKQLLGVIESMDCKHDTNKELSEFEFDYPEELTKEEKIISVIRKAHVLSLQDTPVCVPKDKYIYGFHSFSYEEFLYYIYWRTQFRENNIIDTPDAFLAMFLIEIVNFIESDDYCECLNMLFGLKIYFKCDNHKEQMINKAMKEFVLLYGSEQDYSRNCDFSEFDQIFDYEKVIDRTHPNVYGFVFAHTSGSFKQLSFYKKYRDCLGADFGSFFYSIIDYFNDCGVDILNLWFGKNSLAPHVHFTFVKHQYLDRIKEKKIIYGNNTMYIVSKHSQKCLSRIALDKGQYTFLSSSIMRYPLRLYENIKRKEIGAKLINAELALDDIEHMSENSPALTTISNIYLSDEFKSKFAK